MTSGTGEPTRRSFLQSFPPELLSVADAVLTYLRDDAKVPAQRIRPEALICDDLGVCEEDLDDIVVSVAGRLNRTLPSPPELENLPAVTTVQDLVVFLGDMTAA